MEEEAKDPIEAEEAQEDESPHGDETDWKSLARKWEQRSKANAEKAAAYDELEKSSQEKLQKALDRAAKAEDELKAERAAREADALRERIAREKGVPADLLHGSTEEELSAFADRLVQYATPDPAPKIDRPGAHDRTPGGTEDAKRELARLIFNGGH